MTPVVVETNQLRSYRLALGLSQSRLARLSNVKRIRICLFELGDVVLTAEEQKRICAALTAESDRLRNLPALNLGEAHATGTAGPDQGDAV